MKILMLVGSLRAGSLTAVLTSITAELYPTGVTSEVYAGLDALPHYDQDLDTTHPPAAVARLREAVSAADALLVATPEYNGSLPGVLKNAIDWVSRPRGDAAIAGKPVAVLSVSPSPRGAQWAREDAVKVLRVAGAQPLEQAVGVASVNAVLTDGRLTDADVERSLTDLMANLAQAVEIAAEAARPAA